MGGVMPYGRFRSRNNLTWRPSDSRDPYPRQGEVPPALASLVGDLNRFEQDVLGVGPFGDHLAEHYAAVSGHTVQTVQQVLAAVFNDPRYPLTPTWPDRHAAAAPEAHGTPPSDP